MWKMSVVSAKNVLRSKIKIKLSNLSKESIIEQSKDVTLQVIFYKKCFLSVYLSLND